MATMLRIGIIGCGAIAGMREAHGLMWGKVSSSAALGTIPILILAIILQKYLVRGLSLGSFR
jgi:multiple sugar transport system permease protein